MSANPVDLVNSVLHEFGEIPIQNLDNEDNEEAVAIKALLNSSRLQELSSFQWVFSQTLRTLTPLDEVAVQGYLYTYLMPDDRLGEINTHNTQDYLGRSSLQGLYYRDNGLSLDKPIILSGSRIYADITPLEVIYHRDVPFEDCPSHFIELVRKDLARKISMRLLNYVSSYVQSAYQSQRDYAMNINRQSSGGVNLGSSSLISARYGSGGRI